MKNTRNVLAGIFIALMVMPMLSKAQEQINRPSQWMSEPSYQDWTPFNFTAGSNKLKGVEFFKKSSTCGSSQVKVLKLVNSNSYAVTVSFQTSPDQPEMRVMVPASVSIEGNCTATDGNLSKLVIRSLKSGDKEKDKANADFLRGHISVSEMK